MKFNFEHGRHFLSIVYILALCSYTNSNMDSGDTSYGSYGVK